MNDNRADRLKGVLRHMASHPVSDRQRQREMDAVRTYNVRQQKRVFDAERRQANAYQQEQKDPDAKDIGSSFKLQVYISKLNQLLTNKSDLYQQLALALPTMTTPQKLRGTTAEAKSSATFLSRGEIEGSYNEMMDFITNYFQDISTDARVRDAVYQQYLTPLISNLRQTALLFPQFYEALPPGRANQQLFNASKLSIKQDAENSYAMLRLMAGNLEDGIYSNITQKGIDNLKEVESVDALFDAVVAGQRIDQAQAQLQPAQPPPPPLAPAQAVQPPAFPPPSREELAQGITAEEAQRRAGLPAYQPPPVPVQPAPVQPGLNPQAQPFQPPVAPDPLQMIGTPQAPTATRQVVLDALVALAPPNFPGVGNNASMRRLGAEIMNQPNAQALGFDGTARQTGQVLGAIYAQNPGRIAGRQFPGNFPGNLVGLGRDDNAEDEGEDQSGYDDEHPLNFVFGDNFDPETSTLFHPQPYDKSNPLMFMADAEPKHSTGAGLSGGDFGSDLMGVLTNGNWGKQYDNVGGHRPPKGYLMKPDGSLMKGKGFWGSTIGNLIFPGASALSYLATGKSIYDNVTGGGSGSAIIPNRGVSGGCASCDEPKNGGARHRTAPTKRHMINGLPQGYLQRIKMVNPDTEIMDAGLMRLKGLGKVGGATSDELLQSRGIVNTPYPDQPFYGYGVDGDEDESTNLTGLKARLSGGISYGAGRNHRADNMFGYDPVADDYYENTGAEEELAGEGYFRDEYEEPKDMDDDPNPFRVRQENYRIATGKQKRPTYNYVKA